MPDFTHFNEQGRAKMVDVGEKPVSVRTAVAAGRVLVSRETFALIRSGGMKKGADGIRAYVDTLNYRSQNGSSQFQKANEFVSLRYLQDA